MLESYFPELSAGGYDIMSASSPDYNCLAWAAEENDRWWEPDPLNLYYWPQNIPRKIELEAFVDAFRLLGYEVCDNSAKEDEFQKVAIFIGKNGKPTHMARQLENGRWTSKLGKGQDIEHELLGLTGGRYGEVREILKRPIRP